MIPVNTDVVNYSYFMAGVVKIKLLKNLSAYDNKKITDL